MSGALFINSMDFNVVAGTVSYRIDVLWYLILQYAPSHELIENDFTDAFYLHEIFKRFSI